MPKIIDRLWKFINGIRLETFTNTIDFTKEMNDDQLQQTRSLAGIITLFCLVARVYIGVASDETLYSMKTPMLPDQALSPQSIAAASVFFNKLIFNCLYWGLGKNLLKNILLFKYLQNLLVQSLTLLEDCRFLDNKRISKLKIELMLYLQSRP